MGRRKNFESPRGIEPQTFGFRAPILSLIFIYKHDSIDIADPCSMQDACQMNLVIDLAHRRVPVIQWYEHRSAESDGLRFDSSWGAKIFSLSNARERMKNIFLYFITEPKTYPPSYSIGKTCWKIATGNNQVYLHITFRGIFTIRQGLISCPLHGKTALKISNITF